MTACLGRSCSFGLPRVPFINCCQFMYLVISLLVLRSGCGIWLYQFLIIAYLFTLDDLFKNSVVYHCWNWTQWINKRENKSLQWLNSVRVCQGLVVKRSRLRIIEFGFRISVMTLVQSPLRIHMKKLTSAYYKMIRLFSGKSSDFAVYPTYAARLSKSYWRAIKHK